MVSYIATYNKVVMQPKFDTIGRPAPPETAVILNAKSLKAAHRQFRIMVLTHHGVDLDDGDYTLRPAFLSYCGMGFQDNPNPPRVLEKPGRCGSTE
jgi:hypothetical protein